MRRNFTELSSNFRYDQSLSDIVTECVSFVLIQVELEQLQNYLTSEKTVTELNKKVLNRKKKRVFIYFYLIIFSTI